MLYSFKDCTDIKEFDQLDDTIYGYLQEKEESDKDVFFQICTEVMGEFGSNKDDNKKDCTCSKEYTCFLLSVMMRIKSDVTYTNAYLSTIYEGDFTADHLYYVWNQFKRLSLKKMVALDETSRQLLNQIYERSYRIFFDKLLSKTGTIPLEERDKDCVLVLSIQLLGMNHAPTKTLIERVKWLKRLGKKVYIINTTEQYLSVGKVPLFDPAVGTIEESYRNAHSISFGEGEDFEFMQLSEKMTTERKFRTALRVIEKMKPYYILSMGTGSMLGDLCGNIVPTASMALAFSTLPHTMNKMRILGRNLREGEEEQYRQQGIDVIESRFTFELKEQTHTFTRKEYGIPEERFVLVVIGIRLDYEVDAAFAEMLSKACKKGCYVVFAGKFAAYDEVVKEYCALQENSRFIGYCEDIQALMEICDLYVNPVRLGGGFSVIEAFAKGVPGVYTRYGDVYVSGGEAFAVEDIDTMYERIRKYKEDVTYYQNMAEKAKDRAKLMTSSKEAIRDIDEQICRRVRERYW